MIPSPFTYQRAGSVQEALSMLNEDAQVLAGGHSLIPAMKLRLNQPGTVVDISRIEALQAISDSGSHLIIGAGATHGSIAANSLVQQHCSFLAEGAGMIGDIQVRNKGTIGGSLAHADPAADWPGLLIAAAATIKLDSLKGSRTVPAADFFTGFYETAREDNEIITEIHIPKLNGNHQSTYQKFVQPASRYAIVGVAAAIEVDMGKIKSARVAINGLSSHAFLAEAVGQALVGQPANENTAQAAAQHASKAEDVLSDHYASEEYRRHLAQVYTKRAILACL
ncbi:MAG: xanthine dehydrogenase family protein subunit M [Bacteroidota bacterium]